MKKFLRKNEKGFTLIEALIVVIIIAILAALGVVRFLGVREATAEATCQSHLSTLNAALKKYDLEHPADPFNGEAGEWDAVMADAGSPVCPSEGTYNYIEKTFTNPSGTEVTEYEATCSEHGTLSGATQ